MPTIQETTPRLSVADAAVLLSDNFDISGCTLQPLDSERDQNFLVSIDGRRTWVLKITNAAESAAVLDFQLRAIEHLRRHTEGLRLPEIRRTSSGGELVPLGDGSRTYHARVLSYVPGTRWVDARPKGEALFESLGHQLAEMGRALSTFEHPAMERPSEWDIRDLSAARRDLFRVRDADKRALLQRILDRFDNVVLPHAATLRQTVIHADWNDYNILVEEDTRGRVPKVVAAIDFGDMLRTWTISDLAIALAYVLTGAPDPLAAAAIVTSAYHETWPIPEDELDVLIDLVRARLCVSAMNAVRGMEEAPDNVYLQVSQKGVWTLIEKFDSLSGFLANAVLRDACGMSVATRGANALRRELARQPLRPVVDGLSSVAALDLSVGSYDIPFSDLFADGAALRTLVETRAAETNGIAAGRYGEARMNDGEPHRTSPSLNGDEPHTVHLGVDLFLPAGSEVRAPLAGTIHSLHSPASLEPSDEPASVMLEHIADEGGSFFTLYRHLDPRSVETLDRGATIAGGDVIGVVASSRLWPSHVHVQVLLEPIADARECPSLAPPSRRRLWQSLCPDPSPILGFAATAGLAARAPSVPALLTARHCHISKSLSISYKRPLAIVRGDLQYLIDAEGRRFLDCVNNVAQVGHSHPRVVNAINRQMALLNTNTRYLHPNLARYAERLSGLMPAPLSVCFFVNSGSEANELALRLARTHTRRQGIIVIDHAYHGNTGALVELSPYKCEGPGGRGLGKHIRKVPMPDVYRGPYRVSADTEPPGKAYARHVKETAEAFSRSDDGLAAFLGESMLGCGGQVVLPEGYLREAYAAIRAAGGVCIADEVQIGFCRSGAHVWGFESQGVVPDIVTLGKSIGNGYPLGAVVTTPEIAESFDNGMEYFNTYGGSPVACAAGLAVIDVLEEERLQERALEVGSFMLAELREMQKRHPIIGDVRGMGYFIGIEFVDNRETLDPAAGQASYVVNRMRDRGVLLSTDGPLHNVIKFKPPLVFNRNDATRVLESLDAVLSEDAAGPATHG